MLNRVVKFADALSSVGATAAAALLVYMFLHFVVEIALRAVFATSTYFLAEFVGYAMAAMTCLAMGHALRRNELIRVGMLLQALDRYWPEARRWVEVICAGLAFLAVGFVALAFFNSALRNYSLGITSYTNLRTPLWIPELVVISGLVILELQLLAHALRTLAAGRPGEA